MPGGWTSGAFHRADVSLDSWGLLLCVPQNDLSEASLFAGRSAHISAEWPYLTVFAQ